VRRTVAAAVTLVAAALALSGCGGSSDASHASGPSVPAGSTSAPPTASTTGDPQLGGMQQKVDVADSAAAAADSDAAQNN
jgi:hypothetical protein